MQTFINISGEDNLDYRDQILDLKVLDMIARELGRDYRTLEYQKVAVRLISNLVCGPPFPSFEQVKIARFVKLNIIGRKSVWNIGIFD